MINTLKPNCDSIIQALETTFNCSVCFHDYDGKIVSALGHGPLYHRNLICGEVRKHRQCFHWCCDMEAMQSRRHMMEVKEPFFKCCHAGLFELVVPVFYDTVITGVIFIGPFSATCLAPESGELIRQQKNSNSVDIVEKQPESAPELDMAESASLIVFAKLLATKLSNQCSRNRQPETDAPHDVRIRDFIDREFRKNLKLSDLAKSLNVSEIRICQLMRSCFGQTFSEMLARRRVEHAKYLLKNSRLKIDAIASDSGFNDSVYFFRIFKRYAGTTPGTYRRKFQSENLPRHNLQT